MSINTAPSYLGRSNAIIPASISPPIYADAAGTILSIASSFVFIPRFVALVSLVSRNHI